MDFSIRDKGRVTTTKNIQRILDTAPTEMDGLTETPVSNHLFWFQEDGGDLSKQKQDLYHTLVKKYS